MSTGYIGSPTGNVIVPISNFTKRTKLLRTTSASNVVISGINISSPGVRNASLMAYADSNNAWRLRFNLEVFGTSGGNRTDVYVTFSSAYAVTFKNLSNYNQAVSVYCENTGISAIAQAEANTARIHIYHSASAESEYCLSGDVELESEPSWAAANLEGNVNVSAYFPNASTTPGLLSYYEDGSFTAYLNDGVSAVSTPVTIYYVRIGKTVTMTIPQVTTVSGAVSYLNFTTTNSATVLTWPANLVPTRAQIFAVSGKVAGVYQVSLLQVSTSATTLYKDMPGNTYAATTNGIGGATITYLLQ